VVQKRRYLSALKSYFENIAIEEICNVDERAKLEKNISPTIALITSTESQEKFLKLLCNRPPKFIKHIMPVMELGEMVGDFEIDKNTLLKSAKKIVEMDKGDKFAVQCRVVEGGFS